MASATPTKSAAKRLEHSGLPAKKTVANLSTFVATTGTVTSATKIPSRGVPKPNAAISKIAIPQPPAYPSSPMNGVGIRRPAATASEYKKPTSAVGSAASTPSKPLFTGVPRTRIPARPQAATPLSKSGVDHTSTRKDRLPFQDAVDQSPATVSSFLPAHIPLSVVTQPSTSASEDLNIPVVTTVPIKMSDVHLDLQTTSPDDAEYSKHVVARDRQMALDMDLLIVEHDKKHAEATAAKEEVAKISKELEVANKDIELLRARDSALTTDLSALSDTCKKQQAKIYTQQVEIIGLKKTVCDERKKNTKVTNLLENCSRRLKEEEEGFARLRKMLNAGKTTSNCPVDPLLSKRMEDESWNLVASQRQAEVEQLRNKLKNAEAIRDKNILLERQLTVEQMKVELLEASSGGNAVRRA